MKQPKYPIGTSRSLMAAKGLTHPAELTNGGRMDQLLCVHASQLMA